MSASAACPHAASAKEPSFFDPAIQQYPFDHYRTLRQEKPVCWVDELNCFMVTTYELISAVIRDTDTYSSLGTQDMIVNESVADEIRRIRASGYPVVPFLATNDPPDHGVYRRLVMQLFSPRRMRGMQESVDRLVETLFRPLAEAGGGDFMKGFATPLPVMVIAELLGVPAAMWPTFRAWGDAYVAPMNGVISPEREVECAQLGRDYQDYFIKAMEERRARPRDDLITELVLTPIPGEDRTMNVPELLSATQQFLVAGGETTTYALGNGILILAQQPALAAELRANPDRVPAFVEEVLRTRSPTQCIYRRVSRDTELNGVKIPKGSFVNVRLGAGNRDETVFTDPEAFDTARKNVTRHLAFGGGIHTCMGATLARMELTAAFARILAEVDVRIDEAAGGCAYFPSVFFMGLEHLHVSLAPIR
ncbi:MAG TPA: cytochrome P450 [Stellaceae bacterium]|nr:cytochrome P450 [Stellaceae bacterium]